MAAVNQQSNLVTTVQYYNASTAKRLAYDQAYQSAKDALAGKLTQAEVDAVVAKLQAATTDLDGKESDVAAVKAAVEAYAATTKTGAYANAKDRNRRAYDQAFQEVTLLLLQEKVTQEQIDTALAKLAAAEKKLDGKPTNFTDLQKLVEYDTHYQAISNKFIYASENIKAAYLEAYAQAKAVLDDLGASQAEVKEAIANLKVARRKLDGRKPRVVKPRKPRQA